MLLTLFILTMLMIGLWLKRAREEPEIVIQAPANTIGLKKSEPAQPDKSSPSKDSEQNPTLEKSEQKKRPDPNL